MKVIRRTFGFDAGHRVLEHPGKCQDFHGHRYYGEIGIRFKDESRIGYAIDFGEIKQIALGAFDHFFDHGMILNPSDEGKLFFDERGKIYIMSYYEDNVFRNPTAENIATEMLCMLEVLFEDMEGLYPQYVELYETPNCSVLVNIENLELSEISGFEYHKGNSVRVWRDTIRHTL